MDTHFNIAGPHTLGPGWHPMQVLPATQDPFILACESLHPGHPPVIGEAHREPDGSLWWAGTGPEIYHSDAISETNGPPLGWHPMPALHDVRAIAGERCPQRGCNLADGLPCAYAHCPLSEYPRRLFIADNIRNHAPAGTREGDMVVLETDATGLPTIWCDPEIADIVRALNQGGVRTIASCSGHGVHHGSVMLKDGRELLIFPTVESARDADRAIQLLASGVAG